MRDSVKKWCATEVTSDDVDSVITEYISNYNTIPEAVYMSPDNMAHFVNTQGRSITGSTAGLTILSFWHGAGHFPIHVARNYRNVLVAGNETTLERIGWSEVDEVFEEEFLK